MSRRCRSYGACDLFRLVFYRDDGPTGLWDALTGRMNFMGPRPEGVALGYYGYRLSGGDSNRHGKECISDFKI